MPVVDLTYFFTGVFGEPVEGEERFVCISFLRPGGNMVERFFRWKDELPKALTLIDQLTLMETTGGRGADIYFCVSLTTGKKRNRDFIDQTHCVWADLDNTPPSKLNLTPTFLIETSPGRYQAIWTLDQAVPYSTAEDFARRIYHAHRKDGADSTWDATRLLRLPNTPNLKYTVKSEAEIGHPLVQVVSATSVVYTLDEMDAAYPISVTTGPGTSQSVVLDYDQVKYVGTSQEICARYHREMSQDVLDLIWTVQDPDDQKWSHRIWALEMGLFELGMDIYEVFVVVRDSACNKYERDGRPEADLWKEIVRARETLEYKSGMVLTTTEIEEIDLLTDEEVIAVTEQEKTFLDRYQDWATSRTDAPKEFHLGGGLMSLSAGLADRMLIPTKFGDVKPNLWVLLMADSTISRKTTSMRLSMEITEGAGVDALLATDGSVEGLLTELQARDGVTSMFMRDEFTSLIAGVKNKDYMSGMLNDLCGMYDGSRIKRRLRKEVIQAKNPVFLLFGGGVESKLLELLGHEDITSGFIPRFLPIFGRTSVSELDLIGKRQKRSFKEKDDLIAEMRAIIDHCTLPVSLIRGPGELLGSTPAPVEVELSDAAWQRLQDAQRYLLAVADGHDAKDLLLPCTERLIVSVLKVASLIAASRLRPVVEGIMQVELDDLMMSLYYARSWLDNMLRIVTRVGRDPFDGLSYKVLEYITAGGEGGVSKAALLRNYRMSARDANEVLETLLDREEITSENHSKRGAIYRATQHARTAKQIRVTSPMTVRRNIPAKRS